LWIDEPLSLVVGFHLVSFWRSSFAVAQVAILSGKGHQVLGAAATPLSYVQMVNVWIQRVKTWIKPSATSPGVQEPNVSK